MNGQLPSHLALWRRVMPPKSRRAVRKSPQLVSTLEAALDPVLGVFLTGCGLLGTACVGIGLFAYRGRRAPKLVGDQLLIKAFPGTLCGLPVAGAGLIAFAVSFWLPADAQPAGILISSWTAVVGVMLFGWCPKRLLPRWMRGNLQKT